MARALAWLAIFVLAATAQWLDNAQLRAACVPALLLALALNAPVLRIAALALAASALAPIAFGRGDATLDLAPALVAALIGWIFLRTLLRRRQPLIARLIAAIDGTEPLSDAAVARYARRLTAVWAAFQFALALLALGVACFAWFTPGYAAPAPRWFGLIVLPAAVAALLLLEFLLRPWLLPQAPRHSLPAFIGGIVRAWPAALRD